MTARDKQDRYASYGELLDDIEALEQGRLRDVVRNNPVSNGHPTVSGPNSPRASKL
ncbi:MAG: hypothetical protein HC875_34280 [Anaerolineales bacterium]|nr:hypothetical protein [Anaerolineales bacterium]